MNEDVRIKRRITVERGEELLVIWSRQIETCLELMGPEPDRTFDKARKLRDGLAKSTSTHDRNGDPLLTRLERLVEMEAQTLKIDGWVRDLPDEHRKLVNWHYREQRKLGQIAALLGVSANHLTFMHSDACHMIGLRDFMGANDPASSGVDHAA